MKIFCLGILLSFWFHAQAYNPICSSLYLPSYPKREVESIKKLNIGTYNVLNLNESKGQYQNIDGKRVFIQESQSKPEWQRKQIAGVIQDADLDIAILEEVEGLRSLEQFNTDYLGDIYYPICIRGNDTRGIDIGFLVKKDLPIHVDIESYKDVMWKNPINKGQEEKLFSRDLPVLKIYFSSKKIKKDPDMIIIGTHFKSQRSESPLDPGSKIKRGAQASEAAKIIKKLQREYGDRTPVILGGDFNGDIHSSEFDDLTKTGILSEALESKGVPSEDRVTHTFHPHDGPTVRSQLDGIFFTPRFKPCVQDASVYRYKDEQGNMRPIPSTYQERESNPSDHFMLRIAVDFASYIAGKCF